MPKIIQLPSVSVISPNDLIPISQGGSGAKRVTLGQLADLSLSDMIPGAACDGTTLDSAPLRSAVLAAKRARAFPRAKTFLASGIEFDNRSLLGNFCEFLADDHDVTVLRATSATWWGGGPPNWAASTPYAVGDRVKTAVGVGRAYECIIAGTSASSGSGPTGTGSSIVDSGSLRWKFVAETWDDGEQHYVRDLTVKGNGKRNVTGLHVDGMLRFYGENLAFRDVARGAKLHGLIFAETKTWSITGHIDCGLSIKNNANFGGNILHDTRRCEIRSVAEFVDSWLPNTAYAVGDRRKTPPGAAWAASTAYAVGDRRTNLKRLYECTVAGTSAGSGGPSGTGSSIVDGTATWKRVVPGVYECTVAGTSASSGGGPVDTGSSIVDGAGALRWKYIAPGVGLTIENLADANDSLGFGANETFVSVEATGGPGIVIKGRTGGGKTAATLRTYVENCALRTADSYPIVVDGITVPERCSIYVADNADVIIPEMIMIPPITQDDGHGLLLGDNAFSSIHRVKAWSSGPLATAPITCPQTSYCEIIGEFPAVGQNIQNVNFEGAIPVKVVGAGGFSAWGRKGFNLRENRWLPNSMVAAGGNPWLPNIDVSGTVNPASVSEVTDPRFGTVKQITFSSGLGFLLPTHTNRGAHTVFAAGAPYVGECVGVSFLARLASGTGTVEFYLPLGAGNATAQVQLDTDWQEIILLQQCVDTTADRALYYYPRTTGGPGMMLDCFRSLRVPRPQDLAPLLRGECTPFA